jgi:hypothetical protein
MSPGLGVVELPSGIILYLTDDGVYTWNPADDSTNLVVPNGRLTGQKDMCLLASGQVFIMCNNSPCFLMDPTTFALTNAGGGGARTLGEMIAYLPDGKLFLATGGSGSVIYDPVVDTFTPYIAAANGTKPHTSSDNGVWLYRSGSSRAQKYDLATGTITTAAGAAAGLGGGCWLPDGRMFGMSDQAYLIYLLNPNGSITTTGYSYAMTNSFGSAHLTQDARVVVSMQNEDDQWQITAYKYFQEQVQLPLSLVTSPMFNVR